ncbi:hypothetical protein [Streptococcus cristatus]|uniref:Uncharacterized protein n=1 Tax=Streptococcus cristatus TaxID=45634 RepID=A0A139N511_STRCR|nr:hypothetical protein [Streptococcus cristatus]KXT71126.1 hypothetical protein SCRDD08_00168 [Streptococcus cristatus]
MRQRKNLILFSLAGLALAAGLIWGILTYLKATEKIYSDRTPASIDSIQVFDDQKFVLVGMKNHKGGNIYYGQNFVTTVAEHTLYTGNMERPAPIGKEEYYRVISYDLNSPDMKKKEFDLYQLLGKDNIYRAFPITLSSYYQEGTDYFSLDIEKLRHQDKVSGNIKQLLFTASGELITDNAEAKIKELDQKPNSFLHKVNWSRGGISEQIDKALEKYHLWYRENDIETVSEENVDYRNRIDISGTNFARLYPEVAKNMKNIKLLYFRPEQYNEREWFDKLIHWFAPEGQDVIELYATDEQTGEKTQIHSYDEFVAWIAAHPEKEKTE